MENHGFSPNAPVSELWSEYTQKPSSTVQHKPAIEAQEITYLIFPGFLSLPESGFGASFVLERSEAEGLFSWEFSVV